MLILAMDSHLHGNDKNLLVVRLKMLLRMVGLLGLVLSLTACPYSRVAFGPCGYRVQSAECFGEFVPDTDVILSSYHAVDSLLTPNVPADSRLLVTTIADINDLANSSPLGRLLGEQLGSRLAQLGYTVLEVKLNKDAVMMSGSGEFALSRAVQEYAQKQGATAVVAGTYAIGKDMVYVTLKLLDWRDSRVISAYAYTLPLGSNVQALLQQPRRWWWQ